VRAYSDKKDTQKKPYYTDRFYIAPQVPKADVSTDDVFNNDLEVIKEKFEVSQAYLQLNHLVVYIKAEDNYAVLELLKEKLNYEQMMEMSAIDWLAKDGTFEIFYEMLSLSKAKRIRIKCFIDEDQAIESVEKLYRSADWSEREMYDMFGIKVNNHPFLKRILMPDDWEGHPLRKTYPLEGDEFASWYEVDKIFGKEARDVIGPELRDSAHIDRYDTERFARLGHEVPFGAKFKENESNADIEFQEPKGVFMVTKFDASKTVTITDRDR
jgi:NADH-quinone oxidoreductase subunit C